MPERLPLVRLALAFVLGGIFIYTGVVKALDPLHFASEIENYRLVSWPIGMGAAFYLPWLEILCGLALIVGWMRSGAVAILIGAMSFFLVLSLVTRARGIDLACGCFGHAGKELGFTSHLAIDFVLLAALCLLWFWSGRTAKPLQPQAQPSYRPA